MRENESAMRQATRRLLLAFIYSLGIASASGLLLMLPLSNAHATLTALVAHLVSGALALIFFAPFLWLHLREGDRPEIRRGVNSVRLHHRLLGRLSAWCAGLTLISGLGIALPGVLYLSGHSVIWPLGANAPLVLAHLGLSVPLFVFLLLHSPRKARP
ncbi:MAG: hypothetical protein LBG69_05275 [Zoogloeaceae bacterium]|jgi:hypothetical protein|nr:hypothetical protein [Zoogloeaceae bacterium]